MSVFSGCPGSVRLKTPGLREKTCPVCGGVIETFTTDVTTRCESYGFVAYNDMQSCIQWCEYARQCVGDELYEKLVAAPRRQKEAKSA